MPVRRAAAPSPRGRGRIEERFRSQTFNMRDAAENAEYEKIGQSCLRGMAYIIEEKPLEGKKAGEWYLWVRWVERSPKSAEDVERELDHQETVRARSGFQLDPHEQEMLEDEDDDLT